jgi:hypothetical protein
LFRRHFLYLLLRFVDQVLPGLVSHCARQDV